MDERKIEIRDKIDRLESLLDDLQETKNILSFNSIEWDLILRDMSAPILKQIDDLKAELEN